MRKVQLEILYFFKYLKETEDKLYLSIVDSLSSEYGWKVGYIQNLTMSEALGLLGAIRDRKNSEDLMTQMNVAKGMAGKISSNRVTKNKKKESTNEVKQLQQLARLIGKKVKKVKK